MNYFHLLTFGCKVNQYESAALAEGLAQAGWSEAPPGAAPDIVVVNTCTVTARADQQARQASRRLARLYPGARIWVTGCYAQRAPEELALLPGVAGVLGNREKAGAVPLLLGGAAGPGPHIQVTGFFPGEPFQPVPVSHFPGHTRAWLKVQDGCNHRCSYCIVPGVRGPARSLAPSEVETALAHLAAQGYQEIVLTGIDLGQYGQDLSPPGSLAALVRRLSGRVWPCRLRLSSLEPQEVTAELLDALEAFPGLCPHFHLPLQSGSAGVLRAMNRPYGPEQVIDLAREILHRFPAAALGFDVLVGFPGETAADLEATRTLVAALPAAYLHVFPFSPRPGTPAAALPPVSPEEVQRRARVLREWGRAKQAAFYQAQVGSPGEILIEGPADQPGWLRGLSANYLRVRIPGPPEWRNRRLLVRFTGVQGGMMLGERVA